LTRIGANDPEFNLRNEPGIILRKPDAMDHTFSKRKVTSDLFSMMEGATLLTTSEFADEIIRNIH